MEHTDTTPDQQEPALVEQLNDSEAAPEQEAAPALEVMPSLKEMLRQAELNSQEHHDAWLRAKAEGENIRRRAQEDISKAQKFAVERVEEAVDRMR